MESLLQDLRYRLRTLRKNPGFTFAAVLTLALGIGANTAIFSLANSIVFRPLPYQEPERLVLLAYAFNEVSPANFLDWRAQNQSFESVAALTYWIANLTGSDEPERLDGYAVSPSLFPMLGVKPIQGRSFLPEEEEEGKDNVVMVSAGFWQRRLGSDPNSVGKTLTINGKTRTVVGIMPADFQFYDSGIDIWIPLSFSAKDKEARRMAFLTAVGRLKPGVSLDMAQSDMTGVAGRLEQLYPQTNANVGIKLIPLHQYIVGSIRPAILMLLGAVSFVLLIACGNVANLLLARATSRQKEIGIRLALGAKRLRLIRQLLTESILLSLLGGLLGLALAWWGVYVFANSISQPNAPFIPRLTEIRVDNTVLFFTLGISLLTGILFGLTPALQLSKPELVETLKDGNKGASGGTKGRRLRNVLVVAEVALSLVLLCGAGLMIRSFMQLLKVDLGFNQENLLVMNLSLNPAKYQKQDQMAAFNQQALERIRALPGVQSATLTTTLPLTGQDASGAFLIEGRPEPAPNEPLVVKIRTTDYDYFRTLGIPLKKGRYFTAKDDEKGAGVAIINESTAKRFWPNEEPLGKRIKLAGPNSPLAEIVGVVGNVRHSTLRAQPNPELYFPLQQNPQRGLMLVVRTNLDPASFSSTVRNQIFGVDKNQPVSNIRTMKQLVYNSSYLNRLAMVLLGIFAGVALILAAIGLYSLISYSVTQRTHEIGVRMALGAKSRDIFKMIVREGLVLTLIGIGIGLAAAFALTRLMSTLLFGVSASDPVSFVAVSLLMVTVAFVASYLPARSATRVNPVVALRYE
ncbi:MAG: ABC transporter permease [Acidobacteriota bacterium]